MEKGKEGHRSSRQEGLRLGLLWLDRSTVRELIVVEFAYSHLFLCNILK